MEKNSIMINKKVVEKTKTVEVNGDIIVPDIKPDIVNVINTNGNAYIYKEDVGFGRVRVDGNIDTYVVYLSDNGETRSMQTTISFIESFEDNNIKDDMHVKTKVSIENIDTKVLNERKISIKVNLKIKTEFFEKTEIEILEDLGNIEGIQKLKENLNIKSIIGMNSSKTSIREDIAIDNNLEITEIIKTNIDIRNIESKISYNKVLAKAEANIKIVFLTEDEKINVVETQIPIMSFVDIEKVTEEHNCEIEYVIRNMLFKANSKEMHSISCQVDFEVYCEAFETKNIEIIQDMYGLKENISFSKKNVEVQLECEEKMDKIQIAENVMVEDISNILDVDCMPVILNVSKIGNINNYEGEVKLYFYYEADNRNGLNVKNVKVPFIFKSESNKEEIELKVLEKRFRINNENVECDIDLVVRHSERNLKRINIIENIETKPYEEENDYKMFIYFVKAGDTIWNISKKFKVCMNDIIKANNLENPNKLNIGDRLYIMR